MASQVLYGFHTVSARLRAEPASVEEIFIDSSRSDRRMRDLERLASEKAVRVMAVDSARLDGMARGARHQGVVAKMSAASSTRATLDEVLERLSGPALVLVLDGVTDPHNLGACLRVAEAAGVHAVIAPKDRAAGISATVSKVAAGAAETIPYFMVTNLVRTLAELKERDIWAIGAAEDAGPDLYETEFPASVAWVLGAEGAGLRRLTRERCDLLVRIPMFGRVESINVAIAAGLCLYETRRRQAVRQTSSD